jgi:phospholipid/cholesterol/gamma-HCH transport system ATP-binding protein
MTLLPKASSPQELAIEIKGLQKTFGTHEVLKNVHLKLVKGENLVVLGKSGTGKSVIIKCIVRLIVPDAGEIVVFGREMGALDEAALLEARKKIGFLFQSGALYDSMSVRENLLFPLRVGSRDKGHVSAQGGRQEREKKDALVKSALKSVDLERAIDLMPSELSGGMRKRIGLARTLILQPDIMLYDEPTTGLDSITSKEISQLMLDVQARQNTSSIIITHDMECAKLTANRIAVLKDGEFVEEGCYEALQKSEDPWVRSFFG